MRIQIKFSLAVISTCVLLGGVTSGWAASIGGSFIGRGGGAGAILAPSESAGVFPQTFWNNIDSGDPVVDGSSLSLLDSAGGFTAVKIIYDISDSWNSDGGTATPDEKLMKGIVKANPDPDTAPINNTERMVFVITNLSSTGTYNIIVYASENGNFGQMDLTLGATTYYIEEQAIFSGTFVPASQTVLGGGYEQGVNYAGFTNVTPAANGTITITATKHIEDPQVNDGIGVPGIQIVQVSGPAPPPNTDTCSITANPQPPTTYAVEGGTATFTVGAQGPHRIQWTKNNVPIPGKIDPTLVYSPVVADDGAQIRAVVYNNVNTNISAPARLFVDPNTPPTLTQGFLKVERWENIGGATGVGGISDLKTNIPGAGVTGTTPTTTYFAAGANVPQTSPNIVNFGSRVWGWIKPDVTSEYNFFIRSDDSSQLFLNPVNPGAGTNTLPDVQTDAPICQEDTCCNGFQEPPSARATAVPIFLEAGKLYGVVILYKEGGGGDFVQVAWRRTNDTTAAALLKPIAAASCWTMASGAGQRASLTTQPTSATVFEGRPVSFTVGVSTLPVAGLYGVQWVKNGSPISGATSDRYAIPSAVLGDNNSQFRAIAYTLPGPLTSSIATLTVLADTNPPVPVAAAITRNDGAIQVGVGFDEPVNQADLIPANFSLIGGSSSTLRFPTNTYNDYKGILFDTSGLTAGNTYTVHVANVRDLKGNAISSAGVNVPFTVGNVGWADTGTQKRPGQVVPVGPDGFDILNGGRQEWSSYDEATIAYLKKTNDFDVKVQLVYAEPGSQWTRVGLQARNNLNIGEPASDRGITTGTASAYAQTHVNPSQTLASSGRFAPAGPVDAPTVNTAATGGTVADGTYNVETAYVFANSSESLPSPLATVGTAGGGTSTITVSSPPASPGATGWYAYVTQDAGTRYFRQQPAGAPTAIGTDFVLTATPTTTGAVTAAPVNPNPNNGHEQNQRLTMGGATSSWGSGVAGIPVYPNVWLRLQRSGTTLHGYRSEDGVNWTDQGTSVLTDQQPNMFVGPFAAVETGNIWAAAGHDVYNSPFDPRFDRLMVYQFRNFGNTFPPSLSISRSGGNVIITFTGTLQSSSSLAGPWSNVVGATSPYSTAAAGAVLYFRARGDFP